MEKRVGILAIIFLIAATASAQSSDPRDWRGVWIASGPDDISASLLPGEEISLTPHGAERYRAVNLNQSPAYGCLPPGPTRALQGARAFEILTGSNAASILFEEGIYFRLIYLDGRAHAADAVEFPSWDGHSIGRWDGNSLVVDTIGIDERTWLDGGGLQHSERMHLVERWQKIDADTLRWTVTVEDPVFFTKPFTYVRDHKRAAPGAKPRVLPSICHDRATNPSLRAATGPVISGPARHARPPKFPN